MERVFQLDERMGTSHFNVPGHDGNYGYGGKCLPKDLEAFTKRSKLKEPKYWGAKSKIPYKIIQNQVYIKLHDNWIFKDFNPKKEDFSYKNKWLFMIIPREYIYINYISKDSHNNFLLIPRFVTLNDFEK